MTGPIKRLGLIERHFGRFGPCEDCGSKFSTWDGVEGRDPKTGKFVDWQCRPATLWDAHVAVSRENAPGLYRMIHGPLPQPTQESIQGSYKLSYCPPCADSHRKDAEAPESVLG